MLNLCSVSISRVVSSKLYSDPFREASISSSGKEANLSLKGTNIPKEQSGLGLDLHTLSQKASVYPSVRVVNIKNDKDHPWWHTNSHSRNGYSADHKDVYNYADAASKKAQLRTGISKTPHGFPSGTRTEQVVSASS
ncbi:hypothetical protein Tco_1196163, partial [Tanacetum coccineum]